VHARGGGIAYALPSILDGKTLHLKAGDPIVEVANTLHYGMNQGRIPAEIVVFYSGAADMPITVVEPRRDHENTTYRRKLPQRRCLSDSISNSYMI
jgi:hypothetical protein